MRLNPPITIIQCFSKWAVEPPGGSEMLLGGDHVAMGRYGVLECEAEITSKQR